MLQFLTRVFGSRNERIVRGYRGLATSAGKFEQGLTALSDESLGGKTEEFRARLKEGVTLDTLLPEAFAVVREAARRTLGMRHFDVQLIGGMTLHEGRIAEMRTGEGKDADGHARGLSQCTARRWRACGDGQRIPRGP